MAQTASGGTEKKNSGENKNNAGVNKKKAEENGNIGGGNMKKAEENVNIGDGNKKKAEENGNNGGENQKKAEELHPQPVKEQLPGVQYCVNSPPPWPEAILLGFQHYLLTLGITILIPSILVPQMGGGNVEKARVIQTTLFVSGLNTLLQSLFGTRLPTVVSGSCTYIIPTTSVIIARRYNAISDPEEKFIQTMRGIQGALIIASFFQIFMGFLGLWRNVVWLFSPLSVVPIITFTGLGLYHLGFPMLAKCVEVGLPELIIFVFISQYLPLIQTKIKRCDRFSVLPSILVVWLYAQLLTWSGAYNNKSINTQISCRTDRAGLVSAAPWIYIPYPFQWGSPTFDAGEAFAMMAASFVCIFESTGAFFATARYGCATPVPPSVISRGVGWLGFGGLFNGLFGCLTGSTASVENAGVLALTRVGSRQVIQLSALFMIFFSVFGKFGAIFASIPLPIVAALYCVLFGYVASAGLGFLQFCNLNSFRTKFILGFSFFMGISVPQYFREYYSKHHNSAGWFNDIVTVIFMSHTTVAALVALILESTLSRENDSTRQDTSLYWWQKFSLYASDVRNDEFYALPCGLDKFFPAV